LQLYYKLISDDQKFISEDLKDISEPLQFIAVLNSLGSYVYNLVYHNINIPVHTPVLFDASCNGIQHLSSMTRDLELAINTNVVVQEIYKGEKVNSEDIPSSDLYNYAAQIIQKEIDKIETNSKYSNLLKIKVTRSLVKKSVMTIPYNISLNGVQEQIIDQTTKIKELNKEYYILNGAFSKNGENITLLPSDVYKLGALIFNTLMKEVPSLKTLKEYLGEMSNVILKLDS
jgi:DNA-directed RNA polymerase